MSTYHQRYVRRQLRNPVFAWHYFRARRYYRNLFRLEQGWWLVAR